MSIPDTLDLGLPVRMQGEPVLRPFLKWPGGKSGELGLIADAAPPLNGRYIDPFVGGASILLSVPVSVPAAANDACPELVLLFRALGSGDAETIDALNGVATAWDHLARDASELTDLADAFTNGAPDDHVRLLCDQVAESTTRSLALAGDDAERACLSRMPKDVFDKLARMRAVERKAGHQLSPEDLLANIEGAVKASFYLTLRDRYNTARTGGDWSRWRVADFLFLREYAYAAMFRFNKSDEFNVPYGGVSYNRKSMLAKVNLATSAAMRDRFANTDWHIGDFEAFLESVEPAGEDFVFVDPPYDSEFSDYDNRSFALEDQTRLESALRRLTCPVMVVIKQSEAIRALYDHGHWKVTAADKTYMWTIKSRNDRAAVHLTITNY